MANIDMDIPPILEGPDVAGQKAFKRGLFSPYTKAMDTIEVGDTITVDCLDTKKARLERGRVNSAKQTMANHGKLFIVHTKDRYTVIKRAM